jgi:transcription antitermination protein NusB
VSAHSKRAAAKPGPFSERARARRRAMQALYQWQITGQSVRSIAAQFCEEQDMSITDIEYFNELLTGVERDCTDIDAGLAPFLDRAIAQVDPIERAILRLASFELRSRLDVPFRVVLNEAIDLARDFGAEGGHSYVNGVLDKAAAVWRALEHEHKSDLKPDLKPN